MNRLVEVNLLFDFYGQLLTEKRRRMMLLYYEENLTLAEIGEEYGISRQGVHDALKKAETILAEYEEKLGLVKRFTETIKAFEKIDEGLDLLIKENEQNEQLTKKLADIKKIIGELEHIETDFDTV